VPLPALLSGDDFALSFWVWRDSSASATYQTLFDDNTGSRNWATFVDGSGALTFNGGIYASLPTWGNTTWHHIALRRASGTLITYLDGSQVASIANFAAHSALNLHFGNNPSGGGSNWFGGYDDVAFWITTIPSAGDIANIAAGTLDVATTSPYGLWRIEEGSGSTIGDTSGNGNDGSLSSATWNSYVPSPLSGSSSSIKTWDGLADASVKTWNGLARAAVKTRNGLA
jgi:hypothetical protein